MIINKGLGSTQGNNTLKHRLLILIRRSDDKSIGCLLISAAAVYLTIVGVLMNNLAQLLPSGKANLNLLQRYDSSFTLHRFSADATSKYKGGASACLLVKDENPRLPEWIAYHYHTLPLRSLTVAIDPMSRSSPLEILERWSSTGLVEVNLWNDIDFLYELSNNGTKSKIEVAANVEGHRTRQTYFINRCMADFKRRNKTWVLLIDVDEYITFNRISDTSENVEPEAFPMEEAPDGIPTLMDWYSDEDDFINGWVLNHSSASTTKVKIGPLVPQTQSQVIQPGGIVTDDVSGNAYYLRDDLAIRDAYALAEPPEPMPTLTYIFYDNVEGSVCGNIFGNIYDDDDWKDGEYACIQVDDETPYDQQNKTNVLHGGYVVEDEYNRKYFLEKEQALWPKRLTLKEAREARERLSRSRVDERKKILDVVMEESIRYGNETMGPCVMMPRLRYGSFEASRTTTKSSTVGEINPDDFVTLRYRWHGIKGNYAYGKTLIDVSRIPMEELESRPADTVHSPLLHYCPRQQWYYYPQYATSLFRVNHYLDSLEAFLYREDVRVSRNTTEYCTLAKEGNYSMDTEDSLWLQEFVQDVGSENAKKLLEGTGSFPTLQWSLGKILFSWFYGKPHCI